MKKIYIIAIAGVIIIVGASFYGGMIYGKNSITNNFKQGFARSGQLGQNNRANSGAGFTVGDIILKDDKSVTIKLQDGGSKIILYSSSTNISKYGVGTGSDLIIGQSVTISGQTNSDGSVSAQSIQIRPAVSQPAK